MQELLNDPVTLAVLALILGQSLIYLLEGFRQQRRSALSKRARAQARLELIAWGVISPDQPATAPAVRALARWWLGIGTWSRVGMGAGMLLAAGAILVALALLSPATRLSLSPLTPPTTLAAALLLGGYAFGMGAGAVVGLLVGAPRIGLASARPAVPQASYRVLQVAVLPGALLLLDVLLVGGLDLRFLPQFTRVELWTLGVFPGLMLLMCALSEWFTRRLARLSLRPTADTELDERAAAGFRSRLAGLLLEREIFALFILVVCQWLLHIESAEHAPNPLYTAALPVLAVVLLSMRGLLEQAQQHMHDEPAAPAAHEDAC
ncbi:MAG TPA: hypothetical protein VFU69_12825 [Ktedonobacterales bacterium]|nr:hypothetical protein [Ktedonobacterales bacterium]